MRQDKKYIYTRDRSGKLGDMPPVAKQLRRASGSLARFPPANNEQHNNRFDLKMTAVEAVPGTTVNTVFKVASSDGGCEDPELH